MTINRDSKGRLLPGNILSRSRRKRGGGPKKKPITLVKEAIDNLSGDIPQLFESLKKLALNGDREAQIYLIDRVLGKPTQHSRLDIEGELDLAPQIMRSLLETARRIAIENRVAMQLEVERRLEEARRVIQIEKPEDEDNAIQGQE